MAVKISRPLQSNNQYGFTENISYLMGALQRHETQKHCIDTRKKPSMAVLLMGILHLRLSVELYSKESYILLENPDIYLNIMTVIIKTQKQKSK